MPINRLTAITQLQGSESLALFSPALGTDAKASIPVLLAYLRQELAQPGILSTQYAGPAATGFSIPVSQPTADSSGTWLVLTPTATFAAGTIVLPPTPGVVDKQELLVNTTQTITALTINGNGATAVIGAPATLAANGFFRLRFDAIAKTWYRVG